MFELLKITNFLVFLTLEPNFHQDETQSSVQGVKTVIEIQIRSTRIVFDLFELLKFNYFVVLLFIRLVCVLLSKYEKHSLSLQCHIIKSIAYVTVKFIEIIYTGFGNIP